MEWKAEIHQPRHLRLTIRREVLQVQNKATQKVTTAFEYAIFIYEGGNELMTWDYHQDTLEIAQQFAFEEFDVPLDAWAQTNI